jgi:hypothetical protein
LYQSFIGLLLMLGLTGLALYWSMVAFRLNYHLNRNGVAIQWGLGQQRIPFQTIQQIIPGQQFRPAEGRKGLNLAGLRLGQSEINGFGLLRFRATAPLSHSLLIVTEQQTYVISPQQPDSFLAAWQRRQTLGPTQQWAESLRRQWPLNIPILADPLTWWLLGLAALLNLMLLGYVCLNYAGLPQMLPVHFNNLGQADRIATRATLFILPAAGAIVWLFNALLGIVVYRREKIAAYLLWGSAIAMQGCLWIALITITAG